MTQSLLSLEQQFTLRKYAEQIKNIPRNELEDLFLEAMRQKMAQENVFRDLMRDGNKLPSPEQLQQMIARKDGGCHGS